MAISIVYHLVVGLMCAAIKEVSPSVQTRLISYSGTDGRTDNLENTDVFSETLYGKVIRNITKREVDAAQSERHTGGASPDYVVKVCDPIDVVGSYLGLLDGAYSKTGVICNGHASYQRETDKSFLQFDETRYWVIDIALCSVGSHQIAKARARALDESLYPRMTSNWQEMNQTVQNSWWTNPELHATCRTSLNQTVVRDDWTPGNILGVTFTGVGILVFVFVLRYLRYKNTMRQMSLPVTCKSVLTNVFCMKYDCSGQRQDNGANSTSTQNIAMQSMNNTPALTRGNMDPHLYQNTPTTSRPRIFTISSTANGINVSPPCYDDVITEEDRSKYFQELVPPATPGHPPPYSET